MQFKTLRSSETGKRFADLMVTREKNRQATLRFADKIGIVQWREGYWAVWGGISTFIFPKDFEVKLPFRPHKKLRGEYWISRKTKEGKLLDDERQNLPVIESHQLNLCVGFRGAPFKTIGFNDSNEEYFLFSVGDDWNFDCPADCEEITVAAYKQLNRVPVEVVEEG